MTTYGMGRFFQWLLMVGLASAARLASARDHSHDWGKEAS